MQRLLGHGGQGFETMQSQWRGKLHDKGGNHKGLYKRESDYGNKGCLEKDDKHHEGAADGCG